jgi:hypothetical protein
VGDHPPLTVDFNSCSVAPAHWAICPVHLTQNSDGPDRAAAVELAQRFDAWVAWLVSRYDLAQ